MPSLGIYARGMEISIYTQTYTWTFIITLIIVTKNGQQLKYPSAVKKVNKDHFVLRKKKNLIPCSQLLIYYFALAQ